MDNFGTVRLDNVVSKLIAEGAWVAQSAAWPAPGFGSGHDLRVLG